MRIGLVAPPFIAVPPRKYGGTELFLDQLARGLLRRGIDVVLYTNGESTIEVPVRWCFAHGEWPISGEVEASLKGLRHAAWSIREAQRDCDVIHLNSAPGLILSDFVDTPFVYTVHHPAEKSLSEFYESLPRVSYVTISHFQQHLLGMPHIRTIHHGIDPSLYRLETHKQNYLTFLGRIAPAKGTHLAIEIAHKTGIPLKIAGEIQPMFRSYWEQKVKPHVDGRFIEYLGELGMEEKNDLLGHSRAMLFPIQWNEPFGLVLIEAMACGTPVLALSGGSVQEIVTEGVSGCVRRSLNELVDCALHCSFDPATVRACMEQNFSVDRMVTNYVELYSEITEEQLDSRVEPAIA